MKGTALLNWVKSGAFLACLVFYTNAVLAQDRVILSENGVEISISCLNNPYEAGWTILKHNVYITQHEAFYTLLQNEGPSEIEEHFRLVVDNFPCYYRFTGTSSVLIGSIWEGASELGRYEVDGFKYPFIFADSAAQAIIIRDLNTRCQNAGDLFAITRLPPFAHSEGPWDKVRYCNIRTRSILYGYSTEVYVAGLSSNGTLGGGGITGLDFESGYARGIPFVFGYPYQDGKRIELW